MLANCFPGYSGNLCELRKPFHNSTCVFSAKPEIAAQNLVGSLGLSGAIDLSGDVHFISPTLVKSIVEIHVEISCY